MDMTEDIFADQSYGALALQKLAPADSNFRLYKAGWLGKGDEREVIAVTGAVFRHATRGPNKGKLSIMVPDTSRTAHVTSAEMSECQARGAQMGADGQTGLAAAAGQLVSRAVTSVLGKTA